MESCQPIKRLKDKKKLVNVVQGYWCGVGVERGVIFEKKVHYKCLTTKLRNFGFINFKTLH
jgi:hypothetical protein